jgi:hypothetical protein
MQSTTARSGTSLADYLCMRSLITSRIITSTSWYLQWSYSCPETEINKDPDQELKNPSTISGRHFRFSSHYSSHAGDRQFHSTTQNSLIMDKTRRYRDIMDNIMQIMISTTIRMSNLSASWFVYVRNDLPHDQCDEILTVITSIFIPLTFITSVWHEFQIQPEYDWPWLIQPFGDSHSHDDIIAILFWRQRWL